MLHGRRKRVARERNGRANFLYYFFRLLVRPSVRQRERRKKYWTDMDFSVVVLRSRRSGTTHAHSFIRKSRVFSLRRFVDSARGELKERRVPFLGANA